MANRFSVTPLGGMDIGSRVEHIIDRGRQQAKIKEWQDTAPAIIQGGDPDAIAGLMIKFPEMAQQIPSIAGYKQKQLDLDLVNTAKNILINGADPKQALSQHVQNVQQAQEDPSKPLTTLGKTLQNPQHATQWAEKVLALYDPGTFQSYRSTKSAQKETALTATQKEYAQAQKEGFKGSLLDYKKELSGKEGTALTATQKDYALAKKEGFKGSYIDYRKAVSGQGEKTDLEMMKLQTQILDIQDRMMDRADKRKSLKEISDKKSRSTVAHIDSVLGEVDKAISAAKENFTSTGLVGAATSIVPGSPSYNLRRTVDTIKANIGFDRLQQMREQSPTGGALGQVAVQELNALQNSITALDPNMGDEELIVALEKVKKHYNNWRGIVLGKIPEKAALPEGVTEKDIEFTMNKHGVTREKVLKRLQGGQ